MWLWNSARAHSNFADSAFSGTDMTNVTFVVLFMHTRVLTHMNYVHLLPTSPLEFNLRNPRMSTAFSPARPRSLPQLRNPSTRLWVFKWPFYCDHCCSLQPSCDPGTSGSALGLSEKCSDWLVTCTGPRGRAGGLERAPRGPKRDSNPEEIAESRINPAMNHVIEIPLPSLFNSSHSS